MSKYNFIYACWKKELQVFDKNLAALKKHPDTNAVHDIRVSIKKLRSALELYVLISENRLLAYPLKETEDFFNILGRQRDIEICLDLLRDFEKDKRRVFNELKRYFSAILKSSFNWTIKAAKEYNKKEIASVSFLLKTETLPLANEETGTKVHPLITFYLTGCKKYYKQPHRLRQYLKGTYYWIKMIQEQLSVQIAYEKQLHQVLDDFGVWQDLQVFETRIKHFRKDFLPKSFAEYESVKMLETEVLKRKQKLLKATLNKTSRLIKKIESAKKEKSVPL